MIKLKFKLITEGAITDFFTSVVASKFIPAPFMGLFGAMAKTGSQKLSAAKVKMLLAKVYVEALAKFNANPTMNNKQAQQEANLAVQLNLDQKKMFEEVLKIFIKYGAVTLEDISKVLIKNPEQ